jgi:hypothetical protein
MAADPLFAQIREEIPGYAAAAAGSFDGSLYWSHGGGDFDLAPARDAVLALVRAYHSTYEGLGGKIDFGSNDELLATASRGYLFVRVDHPRQRFVAVALKASGNIGYLRFRMREYLRQVP